MNLVDDKSVKVGGTQGITTLNGFAFPLKCTGGPMYLNILGKPTDEELVKYPSVDLTSIHEWDLSVLDYSHPEGDGEPVWTIDPQHIDFLDPNFDIYGMYTRERSIPCHPWLMYSNHLPCHHLHPCQLLKPTSTITEVWHIAHFWVSYGRCAMTGLPMGWSEGLSS